MPNLPNFADLSELAPLSQPADAAPSNAQRPAALTTDTLTTNFLADNPLVNKILPDTTLSLNASSADKSVLTGNAAANNATTPLTVLPHSVSLAPSLAPTALPELVGQSLAELRQLMLQLGEKSFRATQLYQSIYEQRELQLEQWTGLSKKLRQQLATLAVPLHQTLKQRFIAQDGTRRYLFQLIDGREIESVWIPEPTRATICISSQVGCALACEFCLTAQLGLKRNLKTSEIVGQVIQVLNDIYGPHRAPDKQINIVLMGMGEPLLNYAAVMAAIGLLADPTGMAISLRHITLSTAGIVPKIYELGQEAVRPKLAISLTGTTDQLRNRLMPINQRYPLAQLLQACRDFPLKPRERITIEYVMLKDLTDSDQDARRLARLLRGLTVKINLIPHNPAPELAVVASEWPRILQFQQLLIDQGYTVFIRRPRGQDIFAACGQLAIKQPATTEMLV